MNSNAPSEYQEEEEETWIICVLMAFWIKVIILN